MKYFILSLTLIVVSCSTPTQPDDITATVKWMDTSVHGNVYQMEVVYSNDIPYDVIEVNMLDVKPKRNTTYFVKLKHDSSFYYTLASNKWAN